MRITINNDILILQTGSSCKIKMLENKGLLAVTGKINISWII